MVGTALKHVDPESGPLELLTARSGEPTARFEGSYLHSARDPVWEAERLIRSQEYADQQVVLFYGFGLGYTVEAFLKLVPEGTAIVAEPSLPAFSQALRSRSLQHILAAERLRLLLEPDPDALAMVLRQHDDRPVAELRQPGLLRVSPNAFDRLTAAFGSFQARSEVNANTLQRFGRVWVRNLVRNLPLLERSHAVKRLFGLHRGEAALVLAGGPSVESILTELPLIAAHAIIVAVDTVLPALVRVGIEPDFVVSVDPQYWNTRHLDRVSVTRAPLISESSTHPLVFRRIDSPVYFCSSLFPLGRYFEETIGDRGTLGAGGSVSTTAWDFARALGCNPIYCAGLDLGFPNRMTHYRGSFFEERIHTLSTRFAPAEGHFRRYLYSGSPEPVAANDGGEVLTDQRMLVYKWWFENQIRMHPETQSYNLSRSGVSIDGMPWVELERLFTHQRRSAGNGEHRKTGADQPGILQEPIEELQEELTALENAAGRALAALERTDPDGWSGSNPELDEADEEIRSFPHRDIVAFLVQSPLRELVATANTSQSPRSVWERAYALYNGLREATHYHRKLLRTALAYYQ
jgi:hypothetical protein